MCCERKSLISGVAVLAHNDTAPLERRDFFVSKQLKHYNVTIDNTPVVIRSRSPKISKTALKKIRATISDMNRHQSPLNTTEDSNQAKS